MDQQTDVSEEPPRKKYGDAPTDKKFMIRCGNGHGVLEPNDRTLYDLSIHLPDECPECGHFATQPTLDINIEYSWANLISRMFSIGLLAIIAGVLYSNSNSLLSIIGIVVAFFTFLQFANFLKSKPYVFEFGNKLKIDSYGLTKLNIHPNELMWVSLVYKGKRVLKPDDLMPGTEIRFFLTDKTTKSVRIGLISFEQYLPKVNQMLLELQNGWKIAY